jgi:pyruvate,water dikinase
MTSRYIRTFAAVRKDDINEVGVKGANLGELTSKGFPVPPGFVVTAAAYTKFFASLRLQKVLHHLKNSGLEKLERSCGIIRNTITNAGFPDELAETILATHQQFVETKAADTVCAVRSSTTTEDISDTSFAGQHATYYYVERANLLRMIQHCWASLWSAEAVSYRNACGIEHSSAMAVVIQEMVRADVSGITFTVDPVSGAREIVVESSWGMGAAIVDGRVTPDRYVLEHGSLELRKSRIAEKRFMVLSTLRPGAISRLEEIDPEMQRKETLNIELLKTVATWSVKAEKYFGSPQDVEWAIADGQFYILQSRPITAMGGGDKAEDPAGQYVLLKSATENSTEPFTPLAADLISSAFSPFTRIIHGRSYLDLKYVRPVLPFKMPDHDLIDLLYGLSADIHLPMPRLSPLKLPFFLPVLLYAYLTFGLIFARTRGMPDDFMDQYRTLCREVEENSACDPAESIQRLSLLPDFFDPVGKMPLWVNFSAARCILCLGPLKMLVRHWLPGTLPDTLTQLCSGLEGMRSTAMDHEISELAEEAGKCEPVRDLLLRWPTEQVLSKIRKEPTARDFLKLMDRFLEKHGHRALEALELQSVRWVENPSQVIGMLRNHLLADAERMVPEKKGARSRIELLEADLREQLEKRPFERLFRPRWRLLHLFFKRIRYLVKLRENSRCCHVMALSVVRKKLLAVESELLAQGRLRCKGDIFFLRLREAAKMQKGRLDWPDVEVRIHRRRLEHLRSVRKSPRKTIGIDLPDNLERDAHSDGDGITLSGQSASPGCYEGSARVILDPSRDPELRPGEILVAPYTDPTWTPLFLTAGAAVVEVGSYLSHAGTIAREYGLPCVVDVVDCAKRIQTGDRLYVDGDQGVVRIFADNGPVFAELDDIKEKIKTDR